jgi:hypothetical protein
MCRSASGTELMTFSARAATRNGSWRIYRTQAGKRFPVAVTSSQTRTWTASTTGSRPSTQRRPNSQTAGLRAHPALTSACGHRCGPLTSPGPRPLPAWARSPQPGACTSRSCSGTASKMLRSPPTSGACAPRRPHATSLSSPLVTRPMVRPLSILRLATQRFERPSCDSSGRSSKDEAKRSQADAGLAAHGPSRVPSAGGPAEDSSGHRAENRFGAAPVANEPPGDW